MRGSEKCVILWCILVRVGGDNMATEYKDKKDIEIATAFADGYDLGKHHMCTKIISWLLENAASYSSDPHNYDPLSMVIDLKDFLNNTTKDVRTSDDGNRYQK